MSPAMVFNFLSSFSYAKHGTAQKTLQLIQIDEKPMQNNDLRSLIKKYRVHTFIQHNERNKSEYKPKGININERICTKVKQNKFSIDLQNAVGNK